MHEVEVRGRREGAGGGRGGGARTGTNLHVCQLLYS